LHESSSPPSHRRLFGITLDVYISPADHALIPRHTVPTMDDPFHDGVAGNGVLKVSVGFWASARVPAGAAAGRGFGLSAGAVPRACPVESFVSHRCPVSDAGARLREYP
jgi:hypothetical protein